MADPLAFIPPPRIPLFLRFGLWLARWLSGADLLRVRQLAASLIFICEICAICG